MVLSGFEAKNTEYYFKLKNEEKTQFKKFPDDVLNVLRNLTKEVINEITSADPKAKKIYDSYNAFQKNISQWNDIAERNYPGL